MKKDKNNPASTGRPRSGPGSDPENKFRKDDVTSVASLNNIITSATSKVKSRTDHGNYHGGIHVEHDEDRT